MTVCTHKSQSVFYENNEIIIMNKFDFFKRERHLTICLLFLLQIQVCILFLCLYIRRIDFLNQIVERESLIEGL